MLRRLDLDLDLRSELEEVIAKEGYAGACGYFITCQDKDEVAALCSRLARESWGAYHAGERDPWGVLTSDKLEILIRILGLCNLSDFLSGRREHDNLEVIDEAMEALSDGRVNDAKDAYNKAFYG